jgi:hypothetical protein
MRLPTMSSVSNSSPERCSAQFQKRFKVVGHTEMRGSSSRDSDACIVRSRGLVKSVVVDA